MVLLNCVNPHTPEAKELRDQLSQRYGVPVVLVNCLDLDLDKIKEILTDLLYEFPVQEISVDMAGWIVSLEKEHWLKKALFDALRIRFWPGQPYGRSESRCGKDL